MKQVSKTQFGKVIVTMYLTNTKQPTWSKGNHNHYRVKITHDKKSHTFDFFGSINEYEKSELSSVVDALNCFMSDADIGSYCDFSEFCRSMGQDEDSISALKTFKSCQKSYKALQRLDIPNDIKESWMDQ